MFNNRLPASFRGNAICLSTRRMFQLPNGLRKNARYGRPISIQDSDFARMNVTQPPAFTFPYRIMNNLTILRSDQGAMMVVNERIIINNNFFFNLYRFHLLPTRNKRFHFCPTSFILVIIVNLPRRNNFLRNNKDCLPSGFHVFHLRPICPNLRRNNFPIMFLFRFIRTKRIRFVVFQCNYPRRTLLKIYIRTTSTATTFMLNNT